MVISNINPLKLIFIFHDGQDHGFKFKDNEKKKSFLLKCFDNYIAGSTD